MLVLLVPTRSFCISSKKFMSVKPPSLNRPLYSQSSNPMNVLFVVEPTPFNYVCGYANRFKETIQHLKKQGDTVEIVTPDNDPNAPTEYLGCNITNVKGFPLFYYKDVILSFDFRMKIKNVISRFFPDIIHVTTPGFLVFFTSLWANFFKIPLVISYHTHFVEYVRDYSRVPFRMWIAPLIVRLWQSQADLTLCTSPQLKQSLEEIGIKNVEVWSKGINCQVVGFLMMISASVNASYLSWQ